MTTTSDVDTAYRRCEQITRSRAANFAYGIRLLPQAKRRALSAIYATARRIDDIGDGTLPPDEKLDRLERTRTALHLLPGDGRDPVFTALADAAARMPIPLAAFDELVDGCAADVAGRAYGTFDELHWYCRCVAGSIGRLSLGVFGAADPGRAGPLADALGVALQLTNILRDLVEDRADGRIYLPAEDLDRFGCTLRIDGTRFADPPDRLIALVRFQADRAARWYDTGLRLLPLLDRRSAACTAAMAGIYRRLLDRIAADPLAVTRSRVSLPVREKAWVAARALVGRPA
ncbi:presqualene diphosphate synthase HpnD [Micromonospora olivasterospora]|uniref:Farnesyl-diphosphate farnesyltransferase n=1 Tax=Micromonospora olivasterospora TaxID=1880 RepID=A0A562IH55_MICOL|nr:presqualene diphosphate synthase HpnD [Micromonospora olivasterospora]TWH70158.1 farnesyl-diphosphate farnesyltransferase [Micromonospora olivasterospora]